MDLASGEVVPVTENLFALECDTKEAVKELQEKLAKLKDLTPGGGKDGGKGDGQAAKELADQLGLGEFGEVLSTLPPGADEFVALARVLRLAEDADEGYERIVIDTAPTGHTLRLLAFPDFLDNFLEKVSRWSLETFRRLSPSPRMYRSQSLCSFCGDSDQPRSMAPLITPATPMRPQSYRLARH